MMPRTTRRSFLPYFVLLLLVTLSLGVLRFRTSHAAISSQPSGPATLALQERVMVQAAKRGNPWISLQDGRQPQMAYKGEATEMMSAANSAPSALASADFDGDGFADLAVGYAAGGAGAISLFRTNPESLGPKLPETQQAVTNSNFPSPFLPDTRVFQTPMAADLIGTGDFNSDGYQDLVVGARGGNLLAFMIGDGQGNFGRTRIIDLPGNVTALTAANAGLWKGATDVFVGVRGPQGPELLIYSDPKKVWSSTPIVLSLPADATAITAGILDKRGMPDVVVAAGNQLVIAREPDGMSTPQVENVALSFTAKAVQIGRFVWDRENRNDLAVLGDDGTIHLMNYGDIDQRPYSKQEIASMRHHREMYRFDSDKTRMAAFMKTLIERSSNAGVWKDSATINTSLTFVTNSQQMIASNLSNGETDDLLLIDSANNKLRIVLGQQGAAKIKGASLSSISGDRPEAVTLDSNAAPIAAMPMKVNLGTRNGLVVLQQGNASPVVMPAAPLATFNVTKTADTADGTCNADCSLREAIILSNATAGPNQINVPAGTYTLSLSSGPIQGDAHTYDNEFLFCGGFVEGGGDLDIGNNDVTITGTGTPIIQPGTTASTTGADGNGIDRVLNVNDCGSTSGLPVSVTLNGLTLKNGKAPSVDPDNNPGTINDFFEAGGVINFDATNWNTNLTSNKVLTLTSVTVDHGWAPSEGGGIILLGGGLTINGTSTISNNISFHTKGGGIAYDGFTDAAPARTLSISGATISGNKSAFNPVANFPANAAAGGGIWAAGGTGVSLTNTNINGANNSDRFGGGLDIESAPTVTITGGTISGNTARIDGGGIWASVVAASAANTPSTMIINNTTINSNTADSDNNNSGNGGGIYVQFGNLTLGNTNAVNINSNAAINGGGVYVIWDGNSLHPSPGFAMTGGTIGQTGSGNAAKNNGGGIAVVPGAATTFGTVNLATVTIQANTANSDSSGGGDGGGIFIDSGNINPLNGDTIDSNVANAGGGGGTGSGIFMNGGSITASNTVSLNGGNTLNINAGTFTSTAGTLNLTGDFTRAAAGTFTHNSGTVNFNGTVAQNINGTATSETFNNFTVNKSGALTVGGSTTSLSIAGNVTLTAGTFAAGTATAIGLTGGNWTNNGGAFTPGSGVVSFTNTAGAQAINGSAVTQTFNSITVAKTAQTLSVGGSTTTLNLNGTMLLTSGTFSAGTAANINVGGDWTNNGGTFTPGTGTVTFNGGGAQNLNGSAATQTFNNFTVSKGGGALTGGGGTNTLTVGGNFSITTGTFATGATLTTINVAGNWSNAATFTPGASNTVIFNGNNSTQTLTGTTSFTNLTSNHTGTGSVTASGSSLTVTGLMRVQAGTFTSSSTFNNVQIDAGATLASDGSTMNVSGSWTNNGGTFTPNGNTVNFNGGGAQTLGGTSASQTFNNFTVNKGGNTLSVGASITTLNVGGDLTLTAGTFAAGTAATINVTGNWTNNGGSFTAGAGTVNFNGAAGQTIGGTTATVFNNLTNSDAGGIAMNNDNTVAGTLALGTTDITVANTKTLSQTSATASTGTGDVIGSVKRTNTSTLATAYTFGNPNNRITTTVGTAPSDITVNLVKTAPTGFSGAVTRTYTITPTGGSGITATLRLHYLDAELNGNTEASLILRRFNGAGWAPYPATASDTTNNWVENNVVHNFSPWTLSSCCSPTAGSGAISGRVITPDGRPVEGTVINLVGVQARKTITDANGNYRFDAVATGGFYTVTPSRANFNFAPFDRSFSQLGNQTEAAFTANSLGDNQNPLDTTEYFVRQQYVDVLRREPDENGFNYWSDKILACGQDASCSRTERSAVAAAFFIENEAQITGSFIFDLYAGTLGRRPTFSEYSVDREGVVGGAALDRAKTVFAQNFVQRAEFVTKYQNAMMPEAFVDALLQSVQSAGANLSGERANLIGTYNQTGGDLVTNRAAVVRSVADNAAFKQSQYNQAFVLTEYFSYLRRDIDQRGYNFWVQVLTTGDPGNYRGMVCSFTTSAEYQNRFSTVVSHTNGECGN